MLFFNSKLYSLTLCAKKIYFCLMTTTRSFLSGALLVFNPLFMNAANTNPFSSGYEVYNSCCLFLALTGMILLMFAATYRLLCGVIGAVNVLIGLPVLYFIFTIGFNQSLTGPILSLLIGTMILIRLIGIGTKKVSKDSEANR